LAQRKVFSNQNDVSSFRTESELCTVSRTRRVETEHKKDFLTASRCVAGTAVDIKDSNDANPAVINVGGDDGQWSPARGRPGGRYSGVGGRLADVFLQPPNPLGPTSAQLRWDVSRLGAKKPQIDGFHVKYRPVLDAERG